jgi:hypothetical protein
LGIIQNGIGCGGRRRNSGLNSIDGVGYILTGNDHHLVQGLTGQVNSLAGIDHGLFDPLQYTFGRDRG